VLSRRGIASKEARTDTNQVSHWPTVWLEPKRRSFL